MNLLRRHLQPPFFFFTTLLVFFTLPPFSALAEISLHVTVIGLEDPMKANVLSFLKIEKMKSDEHFTERWMKGLHEEATEDIRTALQPYGYYLPEIQTELSQEPQEPGEVAPPEAKGLLRGAIKGVLKTTTDAVKGTLAVPQQGTSETAEEWWATYTIDPGPLVKISKRDIQWSGEGADNPAFQKSIDTYLEEAGDTLVHSEYEAAKSEFLKQALSIGFPKANITTSEVLVDLEANTAEITIHLDTGPLYFFGDVRFVQDFLNPGLLEKYVTIEKGAPYSHEELLRFQQNLLASNYAQEVTITPLFDETVDQMLPLEVVLNPIAQHKFSFGLGYETDIGVRGSMRWENRRANRRGHHSDVYIKASQKEGRFIAQYNIPVLRPRTDRWTSAASYQYEETPTTASSTFDMETAFVRRNLDDTRFYKGFILASSETFTIDHGAKETTRLLSFGGTTHSSVMDEDLFPQFGHYLFGDLRGASEALLSNTSYARLHLKGRYLFGLGEDGRLDTHMELGTAWIDDFSIYPVSQRFFAGGDQSVRGYTFESLGPKNDNGVVVGGKHMFTCSLEYDHRLAESWVAAGFADAGNAYDEKFSKLYVGAGFGFRWLAPFGSLRVNVAWPVSEAPALDDFKIHIGFGATL
ncbi:MAG: autotransporter assembly complex family protein [Thermodesulfobacteriota bacterium]